MYFSLVQDASRADCRVGFAFLCVRELLCVHLFQLNLKDASAFNILYTGLYTLCRRAYAQRYICRDIAICI